MRRGAITTLAVVVSGLGCNALFSIEQPSHSRCGDGVVWNGEQCDDGKNEDGDGCSARCEVEHGFTCEGEPSVCVSLCGDGIKASDEECDNGDVRAGSGCAPGCSLEAGYACDQEGEPCHTVCGDGLVLADEACDDGENEDGDGCSASCVVELGFSCEGEPSVCASACGDNIQASDEACDDGNTDGGDGCQADCAAIEPGYQCDNPGEPRCSPVCSLAISGCEEEANGTLAEADAMLPGNARIGVIGSTDDIDIFKLTLGVPTVLRAETFDYTGLGCVDGLNTSLQLLLNGVDSLLDDDSGIGQCSMLTVPLPSGVHFFKITGNGLAKMGPYIISLQGVTAGAVELAEPNDMTATPLLGEDTVVTGSIGTAADVDMFSFFLGDGQSVRAEIIEGQGTALGACDAGLIPSRIELWQGQTLLVGNDNGGRGECSRIDGFGPAPVHAEAHDLMTGTYTIRVRASSNASSATFSYRLAVTIR